MDRADPREIYMSELLARGYATSREVLKADFGEWPPNGINVGTEPNETMAFKSFFADKHNKGIRETFSNVWGDLGRVYSDSPDIYLNPYILFLSALSKGRLVRTRGLVGHEHIHLLQFKHASLLFFPHLESRAYIQQVVEVQAYVHQVIAGGYPQWRTLPILRHQLWAALANQGVVLSEDIRQELLTTEGQEAQLVFGHRQMEASLDAISLNKALRSMTGIRRPAIFWRSVVPDLYGNLLELYGDPHGQERMNDEFRKAADNIASSSAPHRDSAPSASPPKSLSP